MFADIDLAQRIDAAASRLTASLALAVPAEHAPFAKPIGGGIAAFGKRGSPINKMIGAGISRTITEAEIEEIEGFYRARGEDTRVELATLARPEVGEMLTARGYRLTGFENVLGLDLKRDAKAGEKTAIEIHAVTDRDLPTWLETLIDGFVAPDDTGVPGETYPREMIEDVTRDFATAKDVRRYLARVAGEPAGAASMRLDAGVAEMCGAATRPALRRRGVQQAMFQKRIDDAREAGCDVAVVNTSPGTRSQQNAERRGFRLLYARAVLVKSCPSDGR